MKEKIQQKSLPVPYWYIWVGALLFTLFAILQSYTSALQGGIKGINQLVFAFWPLNYLIWAIMIPYIFRSYFFSKERYKPDVFFHLIIGLGWCILHYSIVSFGNGLVLKYFFVTESSINLFDYLIYYFPTSILSHCLDYLLITGILLALEVNRKNHQNQLSLVQLENQLKATQLDALKMQLNPHFFFNTLNTIASFMGKNEKGQEVIGKLGRLLRTMLKEEQRQLVSLKKELQYVEDYLSIEEVRFEDRLKVQYHIEEATLQCEFPVLLLQPIIENSLKHGLVNQTGEGQLLITSKKKNSRLVIKVADNGAGSPLSLEEMLQKPGLGLNNVQQRLNHLYTDNYQLEIHTAIGKGFEVLINLPFQIGSPASNQNVYDYSNLDH